MLSGISRRRTEKRFALMGGIVLFGVPSLCLLVYLLVTVVYSNPNCGVSEQTYFTLPPSAGGIERHARSLSRSCTLRIKFRVSPDELERFIETTFIQMPLSSTELPQSIRGIALLQEEMDSELESVSTFLAGEARGTGNNLLDEQIVFVDTTNPDEYVVYLTTKINWL